MAKMIDKYNGFSLGDEIVFNKFLRKKSVTPHTYKNISKESHFWRKWREIEINDMGIIAGKRVIDWKGGFSGRITNINRDYKTIEKKVVYLIAVDLKTIRKVLPEHIMGYVENNKKIEESNMINIEN